MYGRRQEGVDRSISRGQPRDYECTCRLASRVRLTLASEMSFHFFIPAFPREADVVPAAMKLCGSPLPTGRYPLFCAEYCGTEHSELVAGSTVMRDGTMRIGLAAAARSTMANRVNGFSAMGVLYLPPLDQQGRCPIMRRLYGHTCSYRTARPCCRRLMFRESMVESQRKCLPASPDVMPTFQGQCEEGCCS